MNIRQHMLPNVLTFLISLSVLLAVSMSPMPDVALCQQNTAETEVEVLQKTCSSAKLYIVATAHLDTQWRWTIQKTIDEYIPATLAANLPCWKNTRTTFLLLKVLFITC